MEHDNQSQFSAPAYWPLPEYHRLVIFLAGRLAERNRRWWRRVSWVDCLDDAKEIMDEWHSINLRREVSISGAERIANERKRQIEVEGWSLEHDQRYRASILIDAAVCYARKAESLSYDSNNVTFREYQPGQVPSDWPWDREWWKPSDDPIRNLEKAGALIAAEIDRLVMERQHER